jgi:flavin-dependent dehydrogenase
MLSTDVIIVGGGPAGAAAAITLAQHDIPVVMLERSYYEGVRVGETVSPDIKIWLQSLNVWERFLANGHCRSPGVVSLWGSEDPYANDFVVGPHGEGWHLDRSRFDAMLAEAAAEVGVVVRQGWRVNACRQEAYGAWQVEGSREAEELRLQARFLIDAAGRAPWTSVLRKKKVVYDRLVGVVGFFHSQDDRETLDQRTSLETTSDGWWYSAPLPDNRLVVASMTDADLLHVARGERQKQWTTLLQGAPLTQQRLNGYVSTAEPRIVPAQSTLSTNIAGQAWVAIGDAACTFDPLSSQGICEALRSGIEAADAIVALWRGQTEAFLLYTARVTRRFQAYLRLREHYYSREQRWRHSLFWQRRMKGPAFSSAASFSTTL